VTSPHPLAHTPPDAVALVPADSPHRAAVESACDVAGLRFVPVRADDGPEALSGRIVIVDPGAARGLRVGSRAIVLCGPAEAGDAYDAVPPAEIAARLPRALRNLAEAERLRAAVVAERANVDALNAIGQALTAITDRTALLAELLRRARALLDADSGSVYLVEAGSLVFAAAQNDTVAFEATVGEHIAIDESSLAGWVALTRAPLDIPDTHALSPNLPYQINRSFDARTGYETRSLLAVPMTDRDGEVLGVLCFINRTPSPGPIVDFETVLPFTPSQVGMARSIAAQAAVAIENYRLYEDIRGLFRSFVEAAVTAVETRDPSTGGHSWRVAQLTTLLARAVNEDQRPAFRDARFDEQHVTELHFAAILHDFGKIGVREEVLLKASRLHPWEMQEVEIRFRLAAMEQLRAALSARSVDTDVHVALDLLDADLARVRVLNQPGGFRGQTEREELVAIAERWYIASPDESVLRPRDVARLCIPRGTLDAAERREIEQHVEHTYRFLKAIPWTRELRRVPELAYCHHEKLDGTGYPRRLHADDIPLGSKLMTVADIFDALTAHDRPYKDAMPPAKALQILRSEADEGKLLHDAIDLLEERRLWTQLIRPRA
jgi:HD-GYP domain-containing protein (c-di-GMP phosphodiesterase class II)